MVESLDCWVQTGFEQQAIIYQQQLRELGVTLQLQCVEKN